MPGAVGGGATLLGSVHTLGTVRFISSFGASSVDRGGRDVVAGVLPVAASGATASGAFRAVRWWRRVASPMLR